MLDFLDAFVDKVGDFTAHDLGDLAALTIENVSRPLLTLLAVAAHVEQEVLMNEKVQEAALSSAETRIRL